MNPTITENDVIDFLGAKAAELAKSTGQKFVTIYASVGNPCYGVAIVENAWQAYVNNCGLYKGKTLAEVMADALLSSTPAERASKLRAEASAKLAEATALEAGK